MKESHNNQKVQLKPEILVPRLGERLVESGLISNGVLKEALELQKLKFSEDNSSSLLGQILVEQGHITPEELDQTVTLMIIELREALEKANENLEKRVVERTCELQNALEKLSELSNLKANFISNISHELRTPLTHLIGYVDLISSNALGSLNAEQAEAMNMIQHSTERLEELIQDLIQISMAESGSLGLNITKVKITDVCQKAINRIKNKAIRNQVTVQYNMLDECTMVEVDEEKIAWVLTQLLDNAIKFNKTGGTVSLNTRHQEDEIIISIIDDGIGIPTENYNDVFETFHQLDTSSTRHYGGTGLGLSLVRKILESHGSNITLKSTLGSGSRFEFKLKISGPAQII